MILNSNNIQKWLFDYFEGELTTLERKQVEQFILDNPEFHQEYVAWQDSMSETQKEDTTPLYVGAGSLLVSVPFYYSLWFKSVASIAIILSAVVGGSYLMTSIESEYTYNTIDYDYVDIRENNILHSDFRSTINHMDAMSQSLTNEELTYSPGISVVMNSNNPRTTDILNQRVRPSNSINSKSSKLDVIRQVNKTIRKSIAYRASRKQHYSHTKISKTNNKKLKPKKVKDHLRKNISYKSKLDKYDNSRKRSKADKYKFLNFRNDNIKGISNNSKYKDKTKYNKKGDDVTISEAMYDTKISKKKHGIISKMKYMELGLENINDPCFILNNNHTIVLNPSLTGQLGFTRFKTSYRNQMLNKFGNTHIVTSSLDTYFEKLKAGIGIQSEYMHSQGFNFNSYQVTYAQKIEINSESSLSVASTFGYETMRTSSNSNQMELTPGFIIDNSLKVGNKAQYNLGLSSWYSGKSFYGGISVTNLLNPTLYGHQESIGFMNQINASAQLGTDYKKSRYSKTVISPFVVWNKMDGGNETWAGACLRHKALLLGLSGSTSLSAKAVIGVQSNSFRLSYGYDITNSELNLSYVGSHEVSLRLLLGVKNKELLVW